MQARPQHLPDYEKPPLDEMVMGVQFQRPSGYSPIYAKDVWELFKREYPNVQEHPALDPSFETFGAPNVISEFKFQLRPVAPVSRLWFISPDDDRLIQFQPDRLLLNWRRRPKCDAYPHFESLAESFQAAFNTLTALFESKLNHKLEINQAEISYVNNLPVSSFSDVGKILSTFDVKSADSEVVNFQTVDIIKDDQNKPYARFSQLLQSAFVRDLKSKTFRLSLTFRGKPAGTALSDAMDFLKVGREKIVTTFDGMTTEAAHAEWRKKK